MTVPTSLLDSDLYAPDAAMSRVDRIPASSPRRDAERVAHGSEAAAPGEGTRLLLHGEVNFGATPHLEAVLESVVAFRPLQLTIDLSDATGVSLDALAAIVRRQHEVENLIIELPPSICSAILDLTAGCDRGPVRSKTDCFRG